MSDAEWQLRICGHVVPQRTVLFAITGHQTSRRDQPTADGRVYQYDVSRGTLQRRSVQRTGVYKTMHVRPEIPF